MFTPAGTETAYQLPYHFGWYWHGRQPVFQHRQQRTVLQRALTRLLTDRNAHILEHQIEPYAIRALLSLRPHVAPADLTRALKGNFAAEARGRLNLRNLWSRGWLLRSVGSVTNEVLRNCVANQFEHHRAALLEHPETAGLARYSSGGDPSRLGTAAHALFQYNVHVVLVTRRRFDVLDMEVAALLVA